VDVGVCAVVGVVGLTLSHAIAATASFPLAERERARVKPRFIDTMERCGPRAAAQTTAVTARGRYADVTPDTVLDLRAPTSSFLCPLSANTYGIEFLSFTIEDYNTKKLIFEVSREHPPQIDFDPANYTEDALRKIKCVLFLGPRPLAGR
jgi:hypothetical protein